MTPFFYKLSIGLRFEIRPLSVLVVTSTPPPVDQTYDCDLISRFGSTPPLGPFFNTSRIVSEPSNKLLFRGLVSGPSNKLLFSCINSLRMSYLKPSTKTHL